MEVGSIGLITGLIGTITGPAALILAILTYLRDKPNVQVFLQWDYKVIGVVASNNTNEFYGVLKITNIGRRPVFVTHAYLTIPKKELSLFLTDTINGVKLLEGDKPALYQITQEGLKEYAPFWKKMRAIVIDSTGKKYYSNTIVKKPSWAVINNSPDN